jgi:pilus assembly protein CpaF
MRIIQRVVARVGRRIDEVSPMVDARLLDGSRVNAIIPPLALDGPKLSIRRFGTRPLTAEDLLAGGSARPEMMQFLAAAVRSRISFLISGGTGAGKTTLLNVMSAFIPPGERLISIEDSAELQLDHRHVVRLETRNANVEGAGLVAQRDLVRNSLRMRPDRILIGEVRGAEALDMLQAMNTGHEGSLTTIHANDTRDALARLEMMVAMTGLELPVPVVRQYIASGIRLVVHVSRLQGGERKITRISEVAGLENGSYRIEDIFGYRQTGVDSDDAAIGEFYATGYTPACAARMRTSGAKVADDWFTPWTASAEPAANRGENSPPENGNSREPL